MKRVAGKVLITLPFFLLLAAGGWTVCLYFFRTPLPPIGTYVAILAFSAAFITIWPPEEVRGKAAWVVLFAVLMGFEIHNLYRDRMQHDREQNEARKREDDRFAGILKQNQTEFEATMNSMTRLLSEATGGNSYIYFDVSFAGGPIEIEIPGSGVHKGEIVSNGFLKFVGTYPLHNVFVAGVGPRGWLPSIDYGTIFPQEIGRPRQGLLLAFMPDKPEQRFNLFINTSNGSYSQDILFLKVAEKWLWASHFYKYGTKKPIRVWAASGFPKQELNADWYSH